MHSNQRQVFIGKGEAAQPWGKNERSVSTSGLESEGSQMHAQGVWFYSGQGHEQAYASERYLRAVCQVAEDDCWEAGRPCWGWSDKGGVRVCLREGRARPEPIHLLALRCSHRHPGRLEV